jgi:hypothetical protein
MVDMVCKMFFHWIGSFSNARHLQSECPRLVVSPPRLCQAVLGANSEKEKNKLRQ